MNKPYEKNVSDYRDFLRNNGFSVIRKPHNVMHDYAGMNYMAAKRFGIKDFPRHEIWIRNDVHGGEELETLMHEYSEIKKMENGETYWKAHSELMKIEEEDD